MRIKSIDIFRAITMLLMIFVNDLWTLKGIPVWLEHSPADVDFLGLADIVFPSFLFVLGMSIPYAIKSRLAKGQSKLKIAIHIVLRSIALLVMGLFTVNQESFNADASGIPFTWFTIFMIIGFFLVWNVYDKSSKLKQYLYSGLQIVGIGILLVLAFIYRGESEEGNGLAKFGIQWWGILGLIGWAYLTCALIFLISGKNEFLVSIIAFLGFNLINIAGKIWNFDLFIGNGAFQTFSMAGVLVALVFEKYKSYESRFKLSWILILSALVILIAGFILRRFFIISKIWATPTWVLLCIGISILLFLATYWVSDIYKKQNWFRMIEPAGSATLTCYLLPYICYSVFDLVHLNLPIMLVTGILGLLKSLLFALLVIGLAALITKIGIKIKI
jgi:heparan-alpha-glucosaminide N-acetyltransferase